MSQAGEKPSVRRATAAYTGLTWAAILAAALGVGVACWGVINLGGAAISSSPGSPDAGDDLAAKLKAHDESFAKRIDQIKGRSMFYIPSPPPPPPPPERPHVDTTPPPPPAPTKPTTYGGPSIIGIANDSVWFSDGKRRVVGESDPDVTVVSIAPPWDIKVKWKDVEFTVGFFDRDAVVYPQPVAAKTEEKTTTVAEADKKPEGDGKPETKPETKPELKPGDKPETTPEAPKDPPKPDEPKPAEPKPAETKPGEPSPGNTPTPPKTEPTDAPSTTPKTL